MQKRTFIAKKEWLMRIEVDRRYALEDNGEDWITRLEMGGIASNCSLVFLRMVCTGGFWLC